MCVCVCVCVCRNNKIHSMNINCLQNLHLHNKTPFVAYNEGIGGSGGKAPRIFHLGTASVSGTRGIRYPLNRGMCGPQKRRRQFPLTTFSCPAGNRYLVHPVGIKATRYFKLLFPAPFRLCMRWPKKRFPPKIS